MSIYYVNTPEEFQPVLSDGLFFTLSASTFNPLTTYKFKFTYQLFVEDSLVFEGKCSPNPYGLGIVDLQQILETYTDSLPLSYWNTTPIYTHQTFPFSRPANNEVINYYIKTGYEYANSATAPITGYTGYGNLVGPPAVQSLTYKTFRSTMGTNGRATQQDFNIGPFVLSGSPVGVYPTTSGLFLTNAPRYLDVMEEDYGTLAFTNYYLWSGATSGFSEPYYVSYEFFDDQGALITGYTYENITTNGGGPRTLCTQVYQNLYLIDPVNTTTDYNTLYVGSGPANIPNFPANCAQYTVQLFGKFTGSTSPIPATPTPTPTPSTTPILTPTPSSTPNAYCSGCTEYNIYWSGESLTSVAITNCITNTIQNLSITPGLYYNVCSCTFPIAELDVEITSAGACNPYPPVTPTPSSTPACSCIEYLVQNEEPYSDVITYIDCNGVPQSDGISGFQSITICACEGSVSASYSSITELGPCPTPTPTPSVTATRTPTPTPSLSSGCFLSWNINECAGTCSGGICTCESSTPVTVYTRCSVTDITDPDTEIFSTSALVTPWLGDFSRSGSIWNSTGANVTLVCTLGGPC